MAHNSVCSLDQSIFRYAACVWSDRDASLVEAALLSREIPWEAYDRAKVTPVFVDCVKTHVLYALHLSAHGQHAVFLRSVAHMLARWVSLHDVAFQLYDVESSAHIPVNLWMEKTQPEKERAALQRFFLCADYMLLCQHWKTRAREPLFRAICAVLLADVIQKGWEQSKRQLEALGVQLSRWQSVMLVYRYLCLHDSLWKHHGASMRWEIGRIRRLWGIVCRLRALG